MGTRRVSCGWQLNCVQDIASALNLTQMSGYDFLVTPIVHPRFKREFIRGKAKSREGAFTRSDLLLPGHDWGSLVVGKISTWIDADSSNVTIRKNSERAFEQELTYCMHLGLPALLIQLRGIDCTNVARMCHNKIIGNSHGVLWIQVPMRSYKDQVKWTEDEEEFGKSHQVNGAIEGDDDKPEDDTWKWWNRFHSLCNWEKKVGLALEVTADIPSDWEIDRWLAEPVRCIVIPTHVFTTNKKGYPVLSKAHQLLFQRLFTLDIQILITGHNRHEHMKYYHQYMEHLWQTRPADDQLTAYARGYEDYLQCPLQPLMDNLESQTYETFEKDPVKYSQYQKAIFNALLDFKREKPVVMVVGAGRGPLVRATLTAARDANTQVKVYAVEKNPNAAVTLQSRKDEEWGEQVTVVLSDMRDWKAPEKADILVSELLGSFGDNELSPECLDGAQKFLKDDGISIPSKYTSYVAPLQSSKLYFEVRNSRDRDKHHLHHFETPYVVHLHNKMLLDAPRPLFSFVHPNTDEPIDNRRYGRVEFISRCDSEIHGIGGYFDAILYKDVTLSIHPDTHSPGMFSWFPILFPIKEPVPVKKGDRIEVHFWRLSNQRIVWYEWCISSPTHVPIHNPNGRAYFIGL